jgi:hypothetical protein
VTLGLNHLVNSVRGINGLVFELENLPGQLTAQDFLFQISPQGIFPLSENPPTDWNNAPAPTSVDTFSGSPSRVLIQWSDGAIVDRWLRVTVLANGNTGLAAPEVYYIGHLRGETSGPDSAAFTVSFTDISIIRQSVGQVVDSGSDLDTDKSGSVTFADIQAMRSNVGKQLTRITVQTPN